MAKVRQWVSDQARLLSPRMRWLICDAVLVWIAALTALVTVWVALMSQEPGIRWWGGVLQALGVACVVLQLRGAQRLFGSGDVRAAIARWWSRRPRDITGHVVTGQLVGDTGFGRSEVHIQKRGGTVEQRLEALEHRIETVEQKANELQAKVREMVEELRAAIAAERVAREQALQEQRDVLGRFAVGDAWLALFGAGCILLGVLLSAVAPELQCHNLSGATCP